MLIIWVCLVHWLRLLWWLLVIINHPLQFIYDVLKAFLITIPVYLTTNHC